MSALERAPRERKEVVNFMPAEVKVTEEIVVPKGSGERLGDIDNVKIKIDKLNGGSEELKTLHRLCYGRPGKQTTVKKFLRDFCGFAADADLAKKEETIGKLDGKMIKALLSTCDVSTSGTKKDNTSALAAFLQAPFASGKKSLAVKAGEKRKKAENKKARAEKKKGKRGKKAKAGGASALKRPPSAYLLYCNNKRAKVVGENPEAKATQIMQILAEKWKGISAERRANYEAQAAEHKAEYEKKKAALEAKAGGGSKPAKKQKVAEGKAAAEEEEEEDDEDDDEDDDDEDEEEEEAEGGDEGGDAEPEAEPEAATGDAEAAEPEAEAAKDEEE